MDSFRYSHSELPDSLKEAGAPAVVICETARAWIEFLDKSEQWAAGAFSCACPCFSEMKSPLGCDPVNQARIAGAACKYLRSGGVTFLYSLHNVNNRDGNRRLIAKGDAEMKEIHHMVNPRLMDARNGMPVRAAGFRNKFQQLCPVRIVSKKHSREDGYTEQRSSCAGSSGNWLLGC